MKLSRAFILTKEKKTDIEKAKEFARLKLIEWELTPRFTVDYERVKESTGHRVYALILFEDERYEQTAKGQAHET